MNWRRGKNNSPPGTGGVARRAGVVVKSKWFSWISMNEWGGELFDPSTTPSLRATPPVPGGELFFPLLQFIHTYYDRACKGTHRFKMCDSLFPSAHRTSSVGALFTNDDDVLTDSKIRNRI